jgi:hypothetical protein
MLPEMLRVRYPEVSNIDDFGDFTIPRASSLGDADQGFYLDNKWWMRLFVSST